MSLCRNLNGSFSTIWIFCGDASICKERTWQLVRNLLNFLPQPPRMKSWYHDKSYDFQTSFAFYIILKWLGHTFLVMVREQDLWNFLPFHGYSLALHSITWILFFNSIHSIIQNTCSLNLTYPQEILLIK